MANGDKGGGSAPAPDYTALAKASEEAARIGAELGREQLAENKRQYDLNAATLKPAIESQQKLMDQSYAQGTQNYNTFQAEGRPVQQQMLFDAMGLNSDEIARYNELRNTGLSAAKSSWQTDINQQISDLDSSIAKYNELAQAKPTSQTTTSASSGYYVTKDGKLVDASVAAVDPRYDPRLGSEGFNANYSIPGYDRAMASNPNDGSILYRTSGSPGIMGRQNDTYSWIKPLSTTTTTTGSAPDYSKQISDLQSRRDALSKSTFSEGSADTSAANDYMSQVASQAKQRQMDEAAGTAIADSRAGSNQQMNQLLRQGLRMGWSPAKLAAMGGQAAMMGAQSQTAAANAGRTQADTRRTAKLGDVYNTYAGLGSSAPSFYGAGTQAGSAASNSQLGMSGQYMQGIGQGNGTIMQGQGMKMQGLGNILNSQTSIYNSSQSQGDGGMGALIGAGGSIAAAYI